jgi:hypothetical protein
MKQVAFKTLDTATVNEMLLRVSERLHVVSEVIDKWNDCETTSVLPILKDADNELSEVYNDLQLNGHREGPKKKFPLTILPLNNKDKR